MALTYDPNEKKIEIYNTNVINTNNEDDIILITILGILTYTWTNKTNMVIIININITQHYQEKYEH